MRILLASLFLFSLQVSAGSISYSSNIHPDTYYETPDDACAPLINETDYPPVGPNGTVEQVGADGTLSCYYRYSDPTQFGGTRVNGIMVGGKPATVRQKVCEKGQTDVVNWPFGTKDPVTNEVPVFGAIVPPWPVCASGCMNEYVSVDSCFSFPDEDPAKVYCDYNTKYTGTACTTAQEPTKPELPDNPPPDPCDTDPTGEGCGGTDPGDGGGDGGTDPGDGGGDGGTDPGDGGGDGGTDPGDGGGDGGTDPGDGGGGGGTDPGDGGGDGGDDGGSAGGHMNCDAPLACEGDPIACAQLEVQKALMCNGPDLDYPGQAGDIADFLDDDKFKEEEGEEVDVSDFVKEGSRFLTASCPAPLTHTLTNGLTIRIAYDPICQIADSISYLFVALAWVFFAAYVGRSSGGE